MDELDKQLIKAAEALIICAALRAFIRRLNEERNEFNQDATDATISFCHIMESKYSKISQLKVKKDIKGKFMPITTPKN